MQKGRESRQKAVFDERVDSTYQSLEQLSHLNKRLDDNKSAIEKAHLQPSKTAVEATSKLLLPEAMNAEAVARSNKFRAEAELSAKSARTMEALEKKIKSLDESIKNTADQNEKDRLTTLKNAANDYKMMYEEAINLRDKEGWAIGEEYIQTYNVSKDDIANKNTSQDTLK